MESKTIISLCFSFSLNRRAKVRRLMVGSHSEVGQDQRLVEVLQRPLADSGGSVRRGVGHRLLDVLRGSVMMCRAVGMLSSFQAICRRRRSAC